MPKLPELYLLRDRQCVLCERLVAVLEASDPDGAIDVIDLEAADAVGRFGHLDLTTARETLTVVNRLGKASRGVDALQCLTALRPELRGLEWVNHLPGVAPAATAACRTQRPRRRRFCLECGEKWMPSLKSSRRSREG